MPEDVTTTKQPALLGYFEVDPNNDWVMDPAQFLESNGYNTPGHYLNDILDNNEVEMTTGTLALCYGECVIPPGQEKCEHGAPAAKLYFEFQAIEEGDAA